MKNSEFKKRFYISDSLKKNNNSVKKRNGLSLWMIFLAIIVGGLPVYFYLVVSGEMFKFEIIKKLFNSPEPTVTYRPLVKSNPDGPLTVNPSQPKQKYVKKQFSQEKQENNIYSWVDKDGVKQFSNSNHSWSEQKPFCFKGYHFTAVKKASPEKFFFFYKQST